MDLDRNAPATASRPTRPARPTMRGRAPTPSRARGVAALALAGILFGSTFQVVQDAVGRADVLAFLAVRFLFGAAVLWPLARRRPSSRHEIRDGVLAGGLLLVGFVLQTIGLRSTTAATSAFITYLLVVLVPVIAAIRIRSGSDVLGRLEVCASSRRAVFWCPWRSQTGRSGSRSRPGPDATVGGPSCVTAGEPCCCCCHSAAV